MQLFLIIVAEDFVCKVKICRVFINDSIQVSIKPDGISLKSRYTTEVIIAHSQYTQSSYLSYPWINPESI
jgi:hypothetical protein